MTESMQKPQKHPSSQESVTHQTLQFQHSHEQLPSSNVRAIFFQLQERLTKQRPKDTHLLDLKVKDLRFIQITKNLLNKFKF